MKILYKGGDGAKDGNTISWLISERECILRSKRFNLGIEENQKTKWVLTSKVHGRSIKEIGDERS